MTLALQRLSDLLARPQPALDPARALPLVREMLERREAFLALRESHGTPLYVFEPSRLRARAARFLEAFRATLPEVHAYFAMKSNNHPWVSAQAMRAGLGLDVSSGVELGAALALGCERILFSGPGKSAAELDLALRHADRVTLLLDSFAELERVQRAASALGLRVEAGVRLTTEERGLWRKFGVPLARLPEFFDRAEGLSHVSLVGLQFHTSWNLTPRAHVAFLERLGQTLPRLSSAQRQRLRFLDIGGGYWPETGEWLHEGATERGRLLEMAGEKTEGRVGLDGTPIEDFARDIAAALEAHIFPHARVAIHAEPGRWVCHQAMHLLLTVADRKEEDLVVLDGGTNIVGWERFEQDYFPVVNLTRPAMTERPCLLTGSLCTPHDVWGYAYFGEGIEDGDLVAIPWQGAYTWSLRQEFIKPLANVAVLPGSE